VAEIWRFKFSGFFAWWLWRTIYLFKLPGLERKLRVAMDWTLPSRHRAPESLHEQNKQKNPIDRDGASRGHDRGPNQLISILPVPKRGPET